MLIILYALIALGPGVFWLIFYRWKDKEEPEPLRLVFKIFIWGMLATIPAALLEFVVDYIMPYSLNESISQIIWGTFLVIAPIEEYLKYLVIKRKVYKRPEFDQRLDGIIYGIVAGLGFASLENVMATLGSGPSIILLRFFSATLMHAFASGIVGYYLGRARFNPKRAKSLIRRGLLIAIIIHGAYNFVITIGISVTIPLLVIIVIGGFVTLNQLIKGLKRRRTRMLSRSNPGNDQGVPNDFKKQQANKHN